MKTSQKLTAFLMGLALASQMMPAAAFAEEPAEAASAVNAIPVTVTAVDAATGKEVPVPNATVSLYVGSEVKKAVLTDENGKATIATTGLSKDELYHATISAYKTVAKSKAMTVAAGTTGKERDGLFGYFPENTDGSGYYRTEYQLHSETIDDNGNWLGESLKVRTSDKVDIVFALDATGSMSPVINNVKNNIEKFSENLTSQGLDIRFSIIEYRDIDEGEETILHTYEGSKWFTDATAVKDVLSKIKADGGGDTPESAVDALGMVADDSMFWRSDAHRFAFLLTDADFHVKNNFGYESMDALAATLKSKGIVTSVVTDSGDAASYKALETTGGKIFKNISSSSFYTDLKDLSDGIVSYVVDAKKLTLKEPRVLYNLSLTYLADDTTSQSESYVNSLKSMMKTYSKDLAQTTDGHVMVNKVILHPTDSRMNFFNVSDMASMGDIQIQSREKDDGAAWFNVRVHSNAYVGGYYHTVQFADDMSHFSSLKDKDSYLGDDKRHFARIQLGGVGSLGEGTGSFIDDAAAYAETLTHESGHYLFTFLDEYMDQDGNNWVDFGFDANRPVKNFGVMDWQHDEIELSKTDGAYSYFGGTFPTGRDPKHTMQSYEHHASTEDTLAEVLADSLITGDTTYQQTYTKAPGGAHRRADYSYSELSDDDFIFVASDAALHAADGSASDAKVSSSFFEGIKPTAQTLGKVTTTSASDSVTIKIDSDKAADYAIYLQKAGEKQFTKYTFNAEKQAVLPVAATELAEMRIVGEIDGKKFYNSYFIHHTDKTAKGCLYTSADDRVNAYTENNASTNYTFLADNTIYTNGDYVSVNEATHVSSDDNADITGGEIYSVASKNSHINYSTLQWFKYADGAWKALKTDTSKDESLNIGGRADLDGAGIYVLMAKASSTDPAQAVTDLEYKQSKDKDAYVDLTFKDPNEGTTFYNVYYSDKKFDSVTDKDVATKTFNAGTLPLSLNLLTKGREVYAAVEAVLEDGRRSPLSEIILIGGEADSDGDGIPDSYCDKFSLWPKDGEKKDIANSDDDGDGLTNLEEYKGGSDPKNPNDPVNTEKVPVVSVSVPETMNIGVGQTATLTATVLPDAASNKTIIWTVEDPTIVKVEGDTVNGSITGLAEGTTTVIATTKDGGYVGKCTVTVSSTPVSSVTPATIGNYVTPETKSLNPLDLVFPSSSSSVTSDATSSAAPAASTSSAKESSSPTTGDATRTLPLWLALVASVAMGIGSKKRRK